MLIRRNRSDYPLPRYGAGAFKSCLHTVHTEAYPHHPYTSTLLGKPHKTTYDFATLMLQEHLRALGGEPDRGIGRCYMVGDNPASGPSFVRSLESSLRSLADRVDTRRHRGRKRRRVGVTPRQDGRFPRSSGPSRASADTDREGRARGSAVGAEEGGRHLDSMKMHRR